MEKIVNAVSRVIFAVDNLLYNTVGIVTPFRKAYWRRRANKIQRELDREHSIKNHVNATHCSNYTTKKAIEVYDAEHCL